MSALQSKLDRINIEKFKQTQAINNSPVWVRKSASPHSDSIEQTDANI